MSKIVSNVQQIIGNRPNRCLTVCEEKDKNNGYIPANRCNCSLNRCNDLQVEIFFVFNQNLDYDDL
jgi:hypothetical protein